MKKSVKKIIKAILIAIVCISFILMCAETQDGSVCLAWNLGWLAVLAISARILDRMGAFDKTI